MPMPFPFELRRKAAKLLPLMAIVANLCLLAACTAATPLAKEGKPVAAIILPANADEQEKLAARELAEHLGAMTGSQWPVASQADSPQAQTRILLGAAADASLEEEVRKQSSDPAGFAIRVGQGQVHIRGLSSQGTLWGVYELLEQLGVRWYFPGELGTVIPDHKTLELADGLTVQTPSFAGRHLGMGRIGRHEAVKTWNRRMRQGGPYFPSAHGIPLPRSVTLETDPDLFALVKGTRVKNQRCISNPRLLELSVQEVRARLKAKPDVRWIGMGPNDGGGFCECDNCQALDGGDWEAFSEGRSVTDRYVWFFNRVLEELDAEYPDLRIGFYAYHTYMRPPVKVKPHPRVVPALAPIALCRIHGPDNPICPEKSYYQWLVQEWGKISPEVYDRGYWFNLADPGMPFPMMHVLEKQIPLGKELGIKGWRVEALANWAAESPSLYIACKLMWDAAADVDALMADYAHRFFGPAGPPMLEYVTMLNEALRDADHHSGSSFDMPHLYPEPLRRRGRQLLQQAASLAGDAQGIHARRVAVFARELDYLDAFVAMIEQRNRHDYAAAAASLKLADEAREELASYDPPLLNPGSSSAYMRRFFRLCTEQGHARTSAGNELVAGLQDTWQFQIDPPGVGEDVHWHLPTYRGGNWPTLLTSSSTWSNQGLRYYKGEAWYRQWVHIDGKFKDKRIFLWFGGIDEKAKVWVNGKLVGISPKGAFIPFELDATDAVNAGQMNLVAVRLSNMQVNELGLGGITAPVMFYAPVKGKAAVLENTHDLGETFP